MMRERYVVSATDRSKIIRYTAGEILYGQRQDFRVDESPSAERMVSHEDTVTWMREGHENLCVPPLSN